MEANLKVAKKRVRKSRPLTVFETDLQEKLSGLKKPLSQYNKDPNETYAKRSIDLWVNNIYKLLTSIGYEDLSLDLLNNHEDIREFIVKKYDKLNTRQAQYNSLIMVYRPDFLLDKFNQDVLDLYQLARNSISIELKKKVQPNENQKEVLDKKTGITKEDISKLMELLKSQSVYEEDIIHRQKYMLYLILLIYSKYQFRNDIAVMRVIKESSYKKLEEEQIKGYNFLVIGKKKMTFIRTDYKMKGVYGKLVDDITDKELKTALSLWLHDGLKLYEDPQKLDYTYLLSQDNGSPISRNNLSQILSRETKKYLGRPISTTLLTKIYDTTPSNLEVATTDDLNKIKKQATIRGHSISVRLNHYSNPNN